MHAFRYKKKKKKGDNSFMPIVNRKDPIPNHNRPLLPISTGLTHLIRLPSRKTNMPPKISFSTNLPRLRQRRQRLIPFHPRHLINTHHLAPLARTHNIETELSRSDFQRRPVILEIRLFRIPGLTNVFGNDDVAPEDVRCDGFSGFVGWCYGVAMGVFFGVGFDGFIEAVY